jgi:hypothetical protein
MTPIGWMHYFINPKLYKLYLEARISQPFSNTLIIHPITIAKKGDG